MTATSRDHRSGADDPSDRPADELDDTADKEELRQRYYGLLQELRVMLPGVQVLVAFLLTTPFAGRFDQLDDVGRALFGLAMTSALAATVCLLTPTAFHQVADRTARSARLVWGIRMTMIGLGLLGVALLTALLCVARFVYGADAAVLVAVPLAVAMAGLWVGLPLAGSRWRRSDGG